VDLVFFLVGLGGECGAEDEVGAVQRAAKEKARVVCAMAKWSGASLFKCSICRGKTARYTRRSDGKELDYDFACSLLRIKCCTTEFEPFTDVQCLSIYKDEIRPGIHELTLSSLPSRPIQTSLPPATYFVSSNEHLPLRYEPVSCRHIRRNRPRHCGNE
jgi:hypothetical protein